MVINVHANTIARKIQCQITLFANVINNPMKSTSGMGSTFMTSLSFVD